MWGWRSTSGTRRNDDSIHITAPHEGKFHTTIKDDGPSVRSHRSLYKHLKRVLKDQGRWPDGK